MKPEEVTAAVHQLIPILATMGIEVTEASDGRAAARLPAEPNRNHFGVTYAGSLFTVAEHLGGVIGMTSIALDGFVPIVKSMQIDFRRPATTTVTASVSLSPDEIETIRSTALAEGKADFNLTCDVVDEAGVIVASTVGAYQIRRI